MLVPYISMKFLFLATLPALGIKEVDQHLKETFPASSKGYEVKLLESGKSKNIKLEDFLSQVKSQLQCPKECEGFVVCEKFNKDFDTCRIEISKKMPPPKSGQDSEPGSIWTLEYERRNTSPFQLKPDSLNASWRDF